MAIKRNLEIEQGAHFDFPLRCKDANGNPVDVTGWTFASQFREAYGAETAQASMQFDMTDAVTGLVFGYIPDEDTALMSAVKGVWDLKYDNGDGKWRRMFEGKYKLSLEATENA